MGSEEVDILIFLFYISLMNMIIRSLPWVLTSMVC